MDFLLEVHRTKSYSLNLLAVVGLMKMLAEHFCIFNNTFLPLKTKGINLKN